MNSVRINLLHLTFKNKMIKQKITNFNILFYKPLNTYQTYLSFPSLILKTKNKTITH